MSILGTVLLGLIVGLLARGALPGKQKMGWVLTCVLGIAGSAVANYVGQALGWYKPGEVAGWFASVGGALVLLILVGKITSKSAA